MTEPHFQASLRGLPPMDSLLDQNWLEDWIPSLGRETVKRVFTSVVNDIREGIRNGSVEDASMEAINRRASSVFARRGRSSLRPLVNATGVVVHTNLGRSCLAEEAVRSVSDVARSYSTLEYDLHTGERGHRNDHVEWLLSELSGAEAALVVNNNAAAVLLCLAALARDREVIVSRGELVEIGGSFRIPDVMAFSGARLVEVGTTNRTHRADYLDAVTPETAMFLKVHPSNFRIQGFTTSVDRQDLAQSARERSLISMEDLGSGMIVACGELGLSGEPTIRDCITAGIDIVTFSGDKMLGGPQIGCIVGKRSLIGRLKSYALLRALRVDKMTLAAFETTLRFYLAGRNDRIPTVRMISERPEALRKKAQRLARLLRKRVSAGVFEVIPVSDAVGGGAFPAETLPGFGVAVRFQGGVPTTGQLLSSLRSAEYPVVAGARDDVAVFHVRTLLEGDEEKLARSLESVLSRR